MTFWCERSAETSKYGQKKSRETNIGKENVKESKHLKNVINWLNQMNTMKSWSQFHKLGLKNRSLVNIPSLPDYNTVLRR